jgi:hypothetical protein
MVGAVGSNLSNVAAKGFVDAQARLSSAAAQLSQGSLDPASVAASAVALRQAEVQAAIAGAVLRADQQNSQQLLDILA